MLRVRLLFAALLVGAAAACSSANHAFVPPSGGTSRYVADTSATAAPANGANALPGNGANALPGNGANALPGNGANALPGASFACSPIASYNGSASCTVAINVNVAVNPNTNADPSTLFGWKPTDVRAAYGIPSGSGGTVAVVDAYDDPNAESDLAVYRTTFGLPSCTSSNGCFRKVNQSGATASYPSADVGWSTEIALDLDMVSAVCPQCKILLVEANSSSLDDLGAGVDTAARLGAVAISNSYYSPEWSSETGEDVHYNHPGIAITASSGDRQYASYPAASQYVTSVGGTSLSNSGGAWSQSAWQYTGHGCSAYVPRPSWQASAGTTCSTRSTVDVAVVADPQTGVAVFSSAQGGWVEAGGTSAGAPIVAAAYALAGNGAGPGYSYRNAADFTPVGSPGYSLLTGLGSPQGISGL